MDILTLAPPLAAIAIAMLARNVYGALLVALILSETLIRVFDGGALWSAPLLGVLEAVDRAAAVFESPGNTRILLFCLIIGALIALIRESGGVTALVRWLMRARVADTRRKAGLAVAGAGTAIFIETNVSLLSSGVLGRALFATLKISRERLAYMIDSTSAPISVLVLLNAWGAYALGLVEPYGFDNAIGVVAGSIPWNFYALLTVAGVYFTAMSDRTFGPMDEADRRAKRNGVANGFPDDGPPPSKALYMWAPLACMVVSALGFMVWTGEGDILAGNGSRSVLWAVCLATALVFFLLAIDRVKPMGALQKTAFDGIGEMVPAVTVLFLSIALGDSLRVLGVGDFVAGVVSDTVPIAVIPALVFLVAGAAAFMTGTSWGTYGVMIPIAMPIALATGLPPSLMLAAVLGGGVFGDHCSPISDTTLIASLASGSDHLAHVRTQLPYALTAAALAAAGYTVAGAFLQG